MSVTPTRYLRIGSVEQGVVVPAFGRWAHEDQEGKAILVFTSWVKFYSSDFLDFFFFNF